MLKPDFKVRGDILVQAFQTAWTQALEDELVTSGNVARAPAELMLAVLVSIDVAYPDSTALGQLAFARWLADFEPAEGAAENTLN
jgi:hypothetical protein